MVRWSFCAMTAKKKQKKQIDSEVQELLSVVYKWQIEANSSHNDGYTREYYNNKLQQLKEAIFPEETPRVIT